MICICATGKFIARRNIVADQFETIGMDSKDIWYLNEIVIDRRKTWVFMNEWSHFSFIKIGMLAKDEFQLYEYFMNGMIKSMEYVGLTKVQISTFVANGQSIRVTKCSNMSKNTSLTDLCKRYKERIVGSEKDIGTVLKEMNQMPQGGLGMQTPIEVIKSINV
jgi:hypothetical protein